MCTDSGSWQDGTAFVELLNAMSKGTLNLEDLRQQAGNDIQEATKKLQAAFGAAEDAFHIPRLLDAQDLLNSTVDEQSIMT